MEYTQWDELFGDIREQASSLNPCCNGIYSMSVAGGKAKGAKVS